MDCGIRTFQGCNGGDGWARKREIEAKLAGVIPSNGKDEENEDNLETSS